MRKILDSSVAVKLLAREKGSKQARHLFQARVRQEIEFIAPEIFIYEVHHALIRKRFRAVTHSKKVNELVEMTRNGFVEIIPPGARLLDKTKQISNIITPPNRRPWSYDATFHALAVLENSQLITADYKYIEQLDILIETENNSEIEAELQILRQHVTGLKNVHV